MRRERSSSSRARAPPCAEVLMPSTSAETAFRIARARRLDEMRRDNDDEVGFLLLILRAAQERAEHRHVADPRKLFQVGVIDVLQQPGHGEALAVAQLDGRVGAPHDQARNRDGADLHHVGGIELTDLGFDFEIDLPVAEHSGCERQPDAELLPFDGGCSERGCDRERELAAGEEVRRIAGERHQIRFGKAARDLALLERLNEDGDVGAALEHVPRDRYRRR